MKSKYWKTTLASVPVLTILTPLVPFSPKSFSQEKEPLPLLHVFQFVVPLLKSAFFRRLSSAAVTGKTARERRRSAAQKNAVRRQRCCFMAKPRFHMIFPYIYIIYSGKGQERKRRKAKFEQTVNISAASCIPRRFLLCLT